MEQVEVAKALAKQGLHVFPCREVSTVVRGKTYGVKSPYPANGFYSGTIDPEQIDKMWGQHPNALIGVWTGPSDIVVLDIDVKRDTQGGIVVDGFDALDKSWLDVPETFSYVTLNGEGMHKVYVAPKNTPLSPATTYRGMTGIDRRSGGSYVVWNGAVPATRGEFTPAPEWLCDINDVRSRAAFAGNTEEWFASLEPGEPNRIVREAIARVKDDFSHSQMIKAQHEAIRLGCEGNPGVPKLISRLEEAWLSRPAEHHTTPTDEWEYKFAEALAGGIAKFGDTLGIRKLMPEWSLELVPEGVPDGLVSGASGDKQSFNMLLRAMVEREPDDYRVLSVMWNSPKTRDLAHEWGLVFVHKRVVEARTTPPPQKENPTLPEFMEPASAEERPTALLTKEQIECVLDHPTFIDQYIAYSFKAKKWVNREYAIPAAWTLLSMAFGGRGFLPKGRTIPLNLWFITLGYSGSGKTISHHELTVCLDLLFKKEGETYYNLGAGSSPEAMHEALLERNKQPSMVNHDEASDFFENLKRRDWMSGLKDNLAKWYDGFVPPVNKVRLKELKGKSAITSFNLNMLATPDRLLGHIDTGMFESGFLARVNWGWGVQPDEKDMRRFQVNRHFTNDEGVNPVWYDCIADLLYAQRVHGARTVALDWTKEAEQVLVAAHVKMDAVARKRDHYNITEPAITRLGSETIWKCAGLLALWRGSDTISEVDALTAVYYAQTWFDNMFRVVNAAGQGEFAHNMDEIELFIRRYPKGITEARVYNRFKGLAKFSSRDVDNLIEYLLKSNRIIRSVDPDTKTVKYTVNG
ncbi:MAG: bifunctional DNA primase/polymerase [Candidatus Omnitrophica bacterium]|nr:bifunctional DNA primase/polymerase [Candidatus Omnitrophota bacterium]